MKDESQRINPPRVWRVGLIGLGRMGSRMGQRILAAGYPLAVYDINPSTAEPLLAAGAHWAAEPAQLARTSELILISVTNTDQVDAVLFAQDGVAAAATPGSVVVDLSTVSPLATQLFAVRLAEKGIDMLDAPVSGGSQGAYNGTLSMMVGGDSQVLEGIRPVLACLATTITHIGDHGMGQAAKMVNQVVLVGNILAMSEGLLLAERCGLDLPKTLQAIQGGAAGSWMLTNLAPKVVARDWRPSFTIELQLKDLRIALQTADALGVPLQGTAQVFQLYRTLAAQGHAQDGNHSLIQALDALAHGALQEIDDETV